MEIVADTSALPSVCLPDASPKPMRRRSKRATRPRLLTLDALDHRTGAAKYFAQLVADIAADLGGRDQLSTIEFSLIEGFAGSAVTLQNLNVRLALGEPVDASQHAQAVSAMVRIASRLGLRKRARDVTPSLAEYLASLPKEDASEAQP